MATMKNTLMQKVVRKSMTSALLVLALARIIHECGREGKKSLGTTAGETP